MCILKCAVTVVVGVISIIVVIEDAFGREEGKAMRDCRDRCNSNQTLKAPMLLPLIQVPKQSAVALLIHLCSCVLTGISDYWSEVTDTCGVGSPETIQL